MYRKVQSPVCASQELSTRTGAFPQSEDFALNLLLAVQGYP